MGKKFYCLVKTSYQHFFKTFFVPILAYGHESWLMTERVRSQVQASEMRFLQKIEGVTLFNEVRSSEIRISLNAKPLLLQTERPQLKSFGYLRRILQERLPKQALLAKANGRKPFGQPTVELDGLITLRILDGIVWDFSQAKRWM